MRADQLKPQRRRRYALRKQIARGEEIPLRLRHLLALDLQVARVKPHARKVRPPARAAALRDLALVVRKDVVLAARM